MLRRLSVLVLLACLLLPGARVRAADGSDAIGSAIEALIYGSIEPEALAIRGLRIAWPGVIKEFYAQREFRPAWDREAAVADLLRALAASHEDGLDPEDYYLSTLSALAVEQRAPESDDGLRAEFDVLCTEALLRLGYHLSFGKVDPSSYDAQWNYGRTLQFERPFPVELESFVSAPDLYARIEALKPSHYLYTGLKRELARHRELAGAGGWKPIASGPVLEPGANGPRVTALRARLLASAEPDTYDSELEQAVRTFQERMDLPATGSVDASTLAELNVPIQARIEQIRVNLDQGRVLLHDLPESFVLVNVAAFQIYLVRGREVVWRARVQVGKPIRRTPIFRSSIRYLVWNPTWTVPPNILAKDILPEARRDPRAIERRGLKVIGAKGRELNPLDINWRKLRPNKVPFILRQDPGPKNPLGRVKLMFPNAHAVYLHDTPAQDLFEAGDRSLSSGCVRVERARELALLALDDPQWNEARAARVIATERTQNVTLARPLPVLLTYWTAWVDGQDRLNFRRDIYDRDAAWGKALAQGFQIRVRPLLAPPVAAP
ncbi:MAG TPA: L,D-transpeptidase family protein [Polyangiales bacterium]|nr:L,D-transpeptidase family protein [Polyangiales bacterium]